MTALNLVALVIDRLQAEVPELLDVAGAAELSALVQAQALPQRMPAAFVLPLGEDAEPNSIGTGALRQRVTERVGIVILARHAGDSRGGKAVDAVVPLRGAVRDALVGWQPDASCDPFELVRSRLQGLTAGTVFVQVDILTRWTLRAN